MPNNVYVYFEGNINGEHQTICQITGEGSFTIDDSISNHDIFLRTYKGYSYYNTSFYIIIARFDENYIKMNNINGLSKYGRIDISKNIYSVLSQNDLKLFKRRLKNGLLNQYEWVSVCFNDDTEIQYTSDNEFTGKIDEVGRVADKK